MTPNNAIFVLISILAVVTIALCRHCPSKEDIVPCICRDGPLNDWGAIVDCENISDDAFRRVTNLFKGRRVSFLTVSNSSLSYIPHNLFKGITLKKLTIRNSKLVALTETTDAFVGLEDHMVQLELSSVVFKKWDWSFLRNLRNIKQLFIVDSLHLETELGPDLMIGSASKLEFVVIATTNISVVSDHAFETFKAVKTLDLDYNRIKHVKRTMFPDPAVELENLNLFGNLIEQLPEDMFTNMPNLKTLYIDYNKILYLDEKTFFPIFEQLTKFFATGNELHCDCRMAWLLEKKFPPFTNGECSSPPRLAGTRLRKLTAKDLKCYV